MNLLLLNDDGLVERWDEIAAIFDKSVHGATYGELDTIDLLHLAKSGRALIMVGVTDDGEIELAAAFEENNFPRMRVLNLFQIAGKGKDVLLRYVRDGWFAKVQDWARSMGFDAIDGSVSPAMLRLCERYGWKQRYAHIRFDLKEGAPK